jgi:hypothetical protein
VLTAVDELYKHGTNSVGRHISFNTNRKRGVKVDQDRGFLEPSPKLQESLIYARGELKRSRLVSPEQVR